MLEMAKMYEKFIKMQSNLMNNCITCEVFRFLEFKIILTHNWLIIIKQLNHKVIPQKKIFIQKKYMKV